MNDLTIVRHENVHAFAERASAWLLQAEAENNLLISIIEQLKVNPQNSGPAYLATIEENGAVTGCAFRTPPHKLGLTRMPHGAVPLLVNDVAQVFDELPAVLGPGAQARAFAEAWAACRGPVARPGMHHRIYELHKVDFPAEMAPGALRLAGKRDHELIVGWLGGARPHRVRRRGARPRELPRVRERALGREAKVGTVNTAAFVEGHINTKTMFLWEDEGEPRTSAVYAGRTPHGVRIGFVYTPPAFRRRGYASACVAMASQRALDTGLAFCCLYADLANPTSNDIYQRMGYRPVCDVMDYEFG